MDHITLAPALSLPLTEVPQAPFLILTGASLAVVVAASLALGIYLLIKVAGFTFTLLERCMQVIGALLGRSLQFLAKEVRAALDLAGSLLACLTLLPLLAISLLFRRRAAWARQTSSLRSELGNALGSAYHLLAGNLAWLLGLGRLTAGLERTLPALDRTSPGYPGAKGRPGPLLTQKGQRAETPQFDGYRVLKELEPGGSGARVFLAEPLVEGGQANQGRQPDPDSRVVLKSFDLGSGSTVPQIVRESRSLAAARSLGIVLHHHLDDRSFWYAMPFVPGETLDLFTDKMHRKAGAAGLSNKDFERIIQYSSDLLGDLQAFHGAGLWHKDIKPGNLIVNGARARVVDLGLVTPLTSAMTLTTHGTEYFRDPELVRMAIRGAKVRDVDGVKFDLYSSGAVLYSMLEGSFPAHGSLSRLTRPCPDALAFIVRRAMADLSKRYTSAGEMLRDLTHLASSEDIWKVRPADLPSLSGDGALGEPVPSRTSDALGASADTGWGRGEPDAWKLHGQDSGPGHQHHNAGIGRGTDPRPRWRPSTASRVVKVLALAAFISVALAFFMASDVPRKGANIDSGEAMFSVPANSDEPSLSQGGAGPRGVLDPDVLWDLPAGSRLIVLGSPGVDMTRPQVAGLKEGMRALGHMIVGEGTDASSIELAANATATLSSAEHYDQSARDRLLRYVKAQDALDAVLWLGVNSHNELLITLVSSPAPDHQGGQR